MDSFGTGVALGILHANAQGDALSASNRADWAEMDVIELEADLAKMTRERNALKAEALSHYAQSVVNAKEGTAGRILLNAFAQALQNLPPEYREQMRRDVVWLTLKRIHEKDVDGAKTVGEKYVRILDNFKNFRNFHELGFDR